MQETRFKLACEAVKNAVIAGNPVVVVDGSPDPEVSREMTRLGARVFPELHKGIGATKRQSFFHATEIALGEGYPAVLAVEAEKDLAAFVPDILRPILAGKADIVVPERSEAGFESYPEFQRTSEVAANKVFKDATNFPCDIFFGPIAFRPEAEIAGYFLAPSWMKYGFPNTYTQHLAVLKALHDRRRVANVRIEFRYPQAQRAEEEGILNDEMLKKRRDQFETLTQGYCKVAAKLQRPDFL